MCCRDIKPDNILLTSTKVVKLADFGNATDFSEATGVNGKLGLVSENLGTLAFWSPEMCDHKESIVYSSYAADMWAAGIVLYIMVYGTFPFWGHNRKAQFESILSVRSMKSLQYPNIISPEYQECLEAILTSDPVKRKTAAQCQTLKWFELLAQSEAIGFASPQSLALPTVSDKDGTFSSLTPLLVSSTDTTPPGNSAVDDSKVDQDSNSTTSTPTTSDEECEVCELLKSLQKSISSSSNSPSRTLCLSRKDLLGNDKTFSKKSRQFMQRSGVISPSPSDSHNEHSYLDYINRPSFNDLKHIQASSIFIDSRLHLNDIGPPSPRPPFHGHSNNSGNGGTQDLRLLADPSPSKSSVLYSSQRVLNLDDESFSFMALQETKSKIIEINFKLDGIVREMSELAQSYP